MSTRTRTYAPSRGISITIQGLPGVEEMLAKWSPEEINARVRLATRAAAKVLRGPLKAEASAASKRMGASVYIHQAKGDKSATVVGHHRKRAFFWHMVIGGTKAHSLAPRKKGAARRSGYPTVRGVRANPIVARVVAAHGERANQAMLDQLMKE